MNLRQTALWSLTALLIAGLLEIASFALYERIAPPYGKKALSVLLGAEDPRKALMELPHPYMLWENNPEFISAEGFRQHNSLGYRGTREIAVPRPEKLVRILCIGGSTTYGFFLPNPEDAWPAQLESILNDRLKDSSTTVEVINGGLNYGTSAEELLHYLVRDRSLNPDLVIIHTGGNDTAPLLFEDYNPEYTHFRPGWNAPVERLRRGEERLLRRSYTLRLAFAFWLRDGVAAPYLNKQSKPYDLDQAYYVRNAERNYPEGFERNFSLLLRNIITDGAKPIVLPFFMIPEDEFPRLSAEAASRAAYTSNIRPGVRIALRKHIEVMRRLTKAIDVPYFEADERMVPPEDYLDHCHLNAAGEEKLAAFVAERVLPYVTGIHRPRSSK